jgi:hypothetical protein
MEDLSTIVADEISLPAELAKSFAVSVAITAGMITGAVIVGHVMLKIKERKERKAQPETLTVAE